MLNFASYIINESNATNTHMARVYERETALHIHDNTGAKNNKDKKYQAEIANLRAEHEADKANLPENIRKDAIASAHRSAKAYIRSLKKNQGIDTNDIQSVHHTGTEQLGDKNQNPQDVIVSYKDPIGGDIKMHGASLKKTQGTLSNNTTKSFADMNKNNGIGANLPDIWNNGKKKIGFFGKPKTETKPRRNDEDVINQYKKTQQESAKHHADSFNDASHINKKRSLISTMKLNYDRDIPYDYVNGEKGTSKPVEEMPHAKAMLNSKSFNATQSGNLVHIHNEKGEHLLTYEHRSTHGPFHSDQVNAKLGSLKVKDSEGAASVKKKKVKEKHEPSGQFGGKDFYGPNE